MTRRDGPQDQLPVVLRQLMTAHDLWKTTDLIPLLVLMFGQPLSRVVRLPATA